MSAWSGGGAGRSRASRGVRRHRRGQGRAAEPGRRSRSTSPGLEDAGQSATSPPAALKFTTDAAAAASGMATFQFIAVGTPPEEDGSADLSHVLAVAETIGRHMTEYQVVVDKSTVPVGTADKVQASDRADAGRRGAQGSGVRRGLESRIPQGRRRRRGLHEARPRRRRHRQRAHGRVC